MIPVPASNCHTCFPSVARYAARIPSARPWNTRLAAVVRTPPPSTTGYEARHAARCLTGSQATSSPFGGGNEISFWTSGPSYLASPPTLASFGLYFHFGSGACRPCVPFFAARYTRPVVGLNAIGFQLCAPPGSGETITGLTPSYAVGDSIGRPVFGSSPLAHVMPLTNGVPEMNSPV